MPWRKPEPAPTRTVRVHRPNEYQRTVKALTSAALVKQPADEPSSEGTGGGTRNWQREAWDFYDLIGELHYAASFVGNCLSRIRLTVALPDEDGTPGPVFDEDGLPLHPDAVDALTVLRELESPIAGVSQVMRAMGLNSFLAGEFYLFGTEPVGAARAWEVLSVDELRPRQLKGPGNKTLYERVEAPGAVAKDIPPDDVVVRVWQPHPRWSMLADSSVRAVRDVLEEIVLLTREVRGQAMSRLSAAGLLVVPAEIDYADDDAASEDTDEGDPFTRDLIRTMATAIADKATAAAVVPFVLRAAYDYCDRIRHIEFARPRDIESAEKRKETVSRLAQGVDLPVEVVLGHMSTTFSNAWQIDESLFKAHIEPKVQTLVDALTICYLRPLIPGTPLIVHYDPSELVSHPDRSGVARDAYDRIELAGSSYRDAIGFSDADAPDDDEIARRIEWARVLKTPDMNAPGAPQAVGAPGGPGGGGGSQPAAGAPGQGPTAKGQPAIAAAAEVAILRAVQRAGARLRSRANGSDAGRLLRGVPDVEVGAILGPTRCATLATPADLFRGEFQALRTWASGEVGAEEAARLVAWAETEAVNRLWAPQVSRA